MRFIVYELPPSVNKFRYFNSLKKSWIKRNLIIHNLKTIDRPCEVKISFFLTNKRNDIDNLLKCILDLLQESKIIKNDYLIYKLFAQKIISNEERIEIEIHLI